MNLRPIRRLAVTTIVALGCLAGLTAPAAHADTLPGNTPAVPFPAAAYSDGCSYVVPFLLPLPDAHVLPDPAPWFAFPVSFRAACDMHDAGYDGGIVFDSVNGGVVDTRTLTRLQVDSRFFSDLITSCRRQIPFYAVVALSSCFAIAGSYHSTARSIGTLSFDASPAAPGPQPFGARANN
jgi:hypothetical protein